MTAVPQNETVTAVVSRAGGPLDGPNSLVDTRIPAPGAPTGHDLLVKVQAVSVNPVDVKSAPPGTAAIRTVSSAGMPQAPSSP